MITIKKTLTMGLVTIASLAGGIQVAQASSAVNPMLVCIYTANNANVHPQPGVGINTYSNAYDSKVGLPSWGVQYTIAQMPGKGSRVCSSEYNTASNGWSDQHFGYTDPITIPTRGFLLSDVACSYKNLVTNRSQIGPGIQYALHYSITKTTANGQPLECVVSNVDLDSP